MSMGTAGRSLVALFAAVAVSGACAADVGRQATLGGAAQAVGAARPSPTAGHSPAVDVTVAPPTTSTPTTPPNSSPLTTAPPATTPPATTPRTSSAAAAPSTAAPAPVPVRVVSEQAWTPFAQAQDVTLVHPSSRVERVGFHQSNHDGARNLEPVATTVAGVTMEGRERETSPRGAADVVVDPVVEIRAPVTGRVKRAGTYVLYCKHSDDYVVIEPDSHPGWEVKMLHIDGVRVRAGDRVVAGETVLAPRPTQLPFQSQVDELATVAPAWPHVHIEVVDPSIPDRPTPGGGCS